MYLKISGAFGERRTLPIITLQMDLVSGQAKGTRKCLKCTRDTRGNFPLALKQTKRVGGRKVVVSQSVV